MRLFLTAILIVAANFVVAAENDVSPLDLPQITVKGERLQRFATRSVVVDEVPGHFRVFVISPSATSGWIFHASGLREGDEIISINGRPISGFDRFKSGREYRDQWFLGKFTLSVKRRVAIGKYQIVEVE